MALSLRAGSLGVPGYQHEGMAMTRGHADAKAKRMHGKRAYAFYPCDGGFGIGITSPNGLNCSTLGVGRTWQAALDSSKPLGKRKKGR
jgi:hypothetical protein